MNYKTIGKLGTLVFALICMTAMSATAQKIGHMNSQAVFAEMPQTLSAKSSMEDYAKQLEGDFTKKEEQLKNKVADAEKRYASGDMTQNELNTTRDALQKQGMALEQTRQKLQTDILKKEDELMKPLIEKFTNSIQEVAKENGYSFIIDSSALLYAEDADDITSKVKAKLGM